jgi:hypothetical protein
MSQSCIAIFCPNWHLIFGLGVTLLLGFFVRPLVTRVGDDRDGDQDGDDKDTKPPDSYQPWRPISDVRSMGHWVGWVERPIFFAGLWLPGSWPIFSSWLVFKLALHWQSANFGALPEEPPGAEKTAYIVAKRNMGSRHAAKAIVGTGANIVAALIGVAAGKWVTF